MDIKEIVNTYSTAIDLGATRSFDKQSEEYKTRREESIKGEKPYKVIISPSRSSFFMDMGGGFKTFHGECQRKAMFQKLDFPTTNNILTASIRKMRYGQVFEAVEHSYEKDGGILVEANYRMNKEISNDVLLSCEVDSVVDLEGKKVIIEIKSYDGYYAIRHVQGNTKREGLPKYDHIAQNMFYLAIVKEHWPEIDTTIFHYRTRGDMTPTYHVLQLDEQLDSNGNIIDAWPVINGVKRTFMSLRGLLSRGLLLANCIIEKKLPPRDPEFSYREDKVRYLFDHGEITKKAYQYWQEDSMPIGDWQCNNKYCRYFNLCMGNTPKNLESWPTDDQIMKTIDQHRVETSDDIDSNVWNV